MTSLAEQLACATRERIAADHELRQNRATTERMRELIEIRNRATRLADGLQTVLELGGQQ